MRFNDIRAVRKEERILISVLMRRNRYDGHSERPAAVGDEIVSAFTRP
jgi:hypothetical protein